MKLDEFLKEPPFKKYLYEVRPFYKEFIKEGCEMFLWPSFSDSLKAREHTSKIEKEKGVVDTNPFISRFINQLSNIEDNLIAFIFPEDYSPSYLMAQEISEKAVRKNIIENIFIEDDTKNWIALFDKRDVKSIGMMFNIVYSNVGFTGDTFGGYKLFGKGLMYYADCLQYQGKPLEPEWPNKLAHFQGNAFRRDTNPRLILESRRVTNMLIRLGYFMDEYELFYNLWKVLLPFLQDFYLKARDFLYDKSCDWGYYTTQLKSKMIFDGKIISKWKSEQTLFLLIKKSYPDALFQFMPSWLEPQSIDIFVPSINTGIEYQGIQHYKSIDYFGGKEAFIHRQELDARKKELCRKNKVRLIEWPYTENISIENMRKFLE